LKIVLNVSPSSASFIAVTLDPLRRSI
jgi:hypothetical protein